MKIKKNQIVPSAALLYSSWSVTIATLIYTRTGRIWCDGMLVSASCTSHIRFPYSQRFEMCCGHTVNRQTFVLVGTNYVMGHKRTLINIRQRTIKTATNHRAWGTTTQLVNGATLSIPMTEEAHISFNPRSFESATNHGRSLNSSKTQYSMYWPRSRWNTRGS